MPYQGILQYLKSCGKEQFNFQLQPSEVAPKEVVRTAVIKPG